MGGLGGGGGGGGGGRGGGVSGGVRGGLGGLGKVILTTPGCAQNEYRSYRFVSMRLCHQVDYAFCRQIEYIVNTV